MLSIFVVGCNGRMGKIVCNLIKESKDMYITGGYDSNCNPKVNVPGVEVSSSIIDLENVDVVIDFSRPSATLKAVEAAIEYNVPMVIATTGFSKDQEATIEEAAQSIPIFMSENMSLGVGRFDRLVIIAAKMLSDYDTEILEAHNSKMSTKGNTSCEHISYFMKKGDEVITLSHRTNNPSIFAEGALKCASYIANVHENRIYTMNDYLNFLGI